eukprot:524435_1
MHRRRRPRRCNWKRNKGNSKKKRLQNVSLASDDDDEMVESDIAVGFKEEKVETTVIEEEPEAQNNNDNAQAHRVLMQRIYPRKSMTNFVNIMTNIYIFCLLFMTLCVLYFCLLRGTFNFN